MLHRDGVLEPAVEQAEVGADPGADLASDGVKAQLARLVDRAAEPGHPVVGEVVVVAAPVGVTGSREQAQGLVGPVAGIE